MPPVLAEVGPAETIINPPEPLFPDPTVTDIVPPLPEVALDEASVIDPLLPIAKPVLNTIAPEALAAFDEATVTDPDVVKL